MLPLLLAASMVTALPPASPRIELSADAGWRFTLGDPAGAETRTLDDANWRVVDLPHDWSIEGKAEKSQPTRAGGGFFPAGIGWYRRTFHAPAAWQGRRVSIEFDGVYQHAVVYLNGHRLGTQPYGYTSFQFDLTSDLDFASPNVLAVRVDNSAQPNSRWYSGSGIYRHVRIVVTGTTHVARWGVFVSTVEASNRSARVSVCTRLVNASAKDAKLTLKTILTNADGSPVGSAQSPIVVDAGGQTETEQEVSVPTPRLWSPESPSMYRAITQVLSGSSVIDQTSTPFGLRTLAWSAERGLQLNGRSIRLHGGSVHHDNGPLGAAAFDRAEQRRVELLKQAGFNAVRTAHNPPSPAFLDACDRLGLLVLDEPFDAWRVNKVAFDYGREFDEWWQRDLSAMVLRDRNHPSIVIWGIGNEIPDAYTEAAGPLARQMATLVRTLDATRPLTQAFPGAAFGPTHEAVASALDMVGYNYNLETRLAADHRQAPSRIMLTTESYPGDAYEQWRLVNEHPFVIGEFVWTAIDYLGESGIGAVGVGTDAQAAAAELREPLATTLQGLADRHFVGMIKSADAAPATITAGVDPAVMSVLPFLMGGFPWHAAVCGDIDLTGWRKPQSYYRDVLWNGVERPYVAVRQPNPEGKQFVAVGWAVHPALSSWTFPGHEGETLQVEVYSAAERVRLLLNGRVVGEQPAGRDHRFKATFPVPYARGTLKAVGLSTNREVGESTLTTAGAPVGLRLSPDRRLLSADGQDLSFIVVEAVDAQGRFQPTANDEIQFSIDGPGLIAAVGNGDGRDESSYQGNRHKLFQGRALVVVRTTRRSGAIALSATASGLGTVRISMDAKAAPSGAELR